MPQSPKMRKLYALADECGLDRDERIDLARVILWRDIVSWSQLTDAQVDRLLDAFEGFTCIVELFRQRGQSRSAS